MTALPQFPPLMQGLAVAGLDPFDKARAEAMRGCEAGLVLYDLAPNWLRAALVLTPEVPLGRAMAMLPVAELGMQNALGALAPPEVAVHLEWGGALRVNGARCGGFRADASGRDPGQVPDWLIVGFDLPLWPESADTGHTPDETALYAEGCADIAAPDLLESWARHTLNWINRWEDEGVEPLHREWRGLLHALGEETELAGQRGVFVGIDEDLGALVRTGGATRLLPLTQLLEDDR